MIKDTQKSATLRKRDFSPALFVGVLTIITAFSGLLLSSPRASAGNTGGLDTSVSITAACSLSVDDTSHFASAIPGSNVAIGTSTITAICNDPAGLAVYMVGYTGNQYGNNALTAIIDETTQSIPTGNAGSPSASQWNMTLTAVTGAYTPEIVSGFTSAQPIPSQYTKVAYRSTVTDMGLSATGANFTAAFNAYVAMTQPAGTYTGKVKVLLVHPDGNTAPVTPVAVPQQICYYGNEEDEGSMACQTTIDGSSSGFNIAITSGSTVTLRASNFSKAGFGFTGWNTKEDGTGTQYGPNETITFTQDMYDNGLVLFANWKAPESGVTMQTFDDTASPYSAAPNGTVIALKDARDDDVYAVAKLADGKWWMIENLRLDYDANITTSNTQSNNGAWGGVFAGLAEPEFANFFDSTAANSLYTTDASSTDLIIIDDLEGFRFPRYNNSNTASRVVDQSSANVNVYSYGNYYTWPAAVADTSSYYDGFLTGTSLCPTGWHLPTGGRKSNFSRSEWWALSRATIGADPANYNSSSNPSYQNNSNTEGTDASKAMRAYPTNLVYSGDFGESTAHYRGSVGVYWASNRYSSLSAYSESFNSDDLLPGSNDDIVYSGLTVRCVAD